MCVDLAVGAQCNVHYKMHTHYVHKTGGWYATHKSLWRAQYFHSSMTNKQRKSEQTKSFSACENISLLYKNTFAKLNTDQCSLITTRKALLVYSLVARRLVGLLRMLGSVSTMSEANNRFSLYYVHMLGGILLQLQSRAFSRQFFPQKF